MPIKYDFRAAVGRASSPDGLCVCLDKAVGVLREMPNDEEDDSNKPLKPQFSDLNDKLLYKQARDEERQEHRCIRRDVLDILLSMAGAEPNQAAEFLEVVLVAAQDNDCRQQALDALSKVEKASPTMFSAGLSSLRAAAREGDKDIRLLALKTLGEVEWKYYFGDVGPTPDLPSNMGAILDANCPFWPGSKVRDTHLLVLIPATVDGKPFTLNLLEELIQRPKNGEHKTKYEYYDNDTKVQFGNNTPGRSYWLLMTRDVLPESCGKSYSEQKRIIAGHAKQQGLLYKLPKALEAATAILAHHVRTGEHLYGNNPWTFTRCQELLRFQFGEYPAVVGCFESSGIDVNVDFSYCGSYDCLGVAGCRKF